MRTKYPDDYQKIWNDWPGRYRGEGRPTKAGKALAYEIWRLMDAEDKEDATKVVCSGRVKNAGTKYLPDMVRWLRDRKWEDYL